MSAKDHQNILKNPLYRHEARDEKEEGGYSSSVYKDVTKYLDRMTLLRTLYDNLKKHNNKK